MKSIVAASLIAGALALDSSSQCSGDTNLSPPSWSCYSGSYGWGTTDIVLEDSNGDSGVVTWTGDGKFHTIENQEIWECNHAAYTRQGTRCVFDADFEIKYCAGLPPRFGTQDLGGYEIEYCPDQDAFRLTIGHMEVIIMPHVACPSKSVTV